MKSGILNLRTAIKNILGAGRRTWLNVAVLSFVFVLMTGYNGMVDGWMKEAEIETREWEVGWGQYWHPLYDRYDVFTLQDAHGQIPGPLLDQVTSGLLTPILVVQAVAYEQGNMQNILLKGIDPEQRILEIPSKRLASTNEDEVQAVIGKRMASTLGLGVGDQLLIRWRDKNGAFDARNITIGEVFDTSIGTVDAGQIWISLENLQSMTGMQGEATYLVRGKEGSAEANVGGWSYKNLDFLMEDLYLMEQSSRIESALIFTILLAIALLAVFDTQTLSIFRRQKEIGTYIALGMTPKRVTLLFTLEGTSYSLLAIAVSLLWGTPVLYWFSKVGLKLPESYAELGFGMKEALYPVYQVSTILTSVLILVSLSMLISYLPARKIARSNVVEALKGKIT